MDCFIKIVLDGIRCTYLLKLKTRQPFINSSIFDCLQPGKVFNGLLPSECQTVYRFQPIYRLFDKNQSETNQKYKNQLKKKRGKHFARHVGNRGRMLFLRQDKVLLLF